MKTCAMDCHTRPWNKGSSKVQMAFTLFQNKELGVPFKRRLSNATLNLLFLRCEFKSQVSKLLQLVQKVDTLALFQKVRLQHFQIRVSEGKQLTQKDKSSFSGFQRTSNPQTSNLFKSAFKALYNGAQFSFQVIEKKLRENLKRLLL